MKSERVFAWVYAFRWLLVFGFAFVAVVAGESGDGLASQPKDTDAEKSIVIEIESDKSEVLVAERFQLQVAVTAPQGIKIKLPELAKQIGEFEVLNVRDSEDLPFGTERKWIRSIELESQVAGQHEIPSIEISFVDRRGTNPTAGIKTSRTHSIKVRSTLEGAEDPTQFRDIKSVVFLPETPKQSGYWLIWAAAASGLAIFVVAAVAAIARKKILTPKQHAIQSLEELKFNIRQSDQDVEQFYIQLVGILRLFVHEQFEISAPRLTTLEFLGAMQVDDRLSDKFRSDLSDLLSLADMVKFAGLLPSGTGLEQIVDHAIRLVENSADQTSDLKLNDSSTGKGK